LGNEAGLVKMNLTPRRRGAELPIDLVLNSKSQVKFRVSASFREKSNLQVKETQVTDERNF